MQQNLKFKKTGVLYDIRFSSDNEHRPAFVGMYFLSDRSFLSVSGQKL